MDNSSIPPACAQYSGNRVSIANGYSLFDLYRHTERKNDFQGQTFQNHDKTDTKVGSAKGLLRLGVARAGGYKRKMPQGGRYQRTE